MGRRRHSVPSLHLSSLHVNTAVPQVVYLCTVCTAYKHKHSISYSSCLWEVWVHSSSFRRRKRIYNNNSLKLGLILKIRQRGQKTLRFIWQLHVNGYYIMYFICFIKIFQINYIFFVHIYNWRFSIQKKKKKNLLSFLYSGRYQIGLQRKHLYSNPLTCFGFQLCAIDVNIAVRNFVCL